MKTLYIDTHNSDICIALYEDTKLLKKEEVLNQKENSRYLVPTLAKVIEGEDYDEILVINGPGSFTGVRLGVTIAKTLAYTKNKPIKACSYFDLLNSSLESKNHVLAISDGNGYFIAEYEDGKLIKDYYYLNNSDFKDLCSKTNVTIDVDVNMVKFLQDAKEVDYTPAHGVNPIYVKLIGVEYDKKNSSK